MASSTSSGTPLGDKWFVYASPEFEKFASLWGEIQKIERTIFPNGQPNVYIGGIEEISKVPGGADILYFHWYRTLQEKKLEEMVLYVLADTYNVRNLIVVDPYDPSATMERVTEEGRIATANVDAHFWKTLPRLASGRKIQRVIFDQHTLQNRFYYSDGSTQLVLRSAVPLFRSFLEEKKGWTPEKKVAIAFPDAGACKRFGHVFKAKGYHLIICAKQRVGDKREVVIEDGDPKEKEVVIVDDLVRSGGTILECASKLVKLGAKSISAYCTHGEFPQASWKRFLPDTCPVKFERFFISDSCPETVGAITSEDGQIVAPFEVFSLEHDINEVLSPINFRD